MRETFESFMEKYRAERSPARNTVIALQRIVPKFLDYCQAERRRQTVDEISREDVIGFLNSLNGNRTSSKRAVKAFIGVFLNGCCAYGLRKERLGPIQFKGPSDVPRAPMKGFTAEEMRRMRENIGRLDLRERIIFNLLASRPLRVSELANLRRADVDLVGKVFTVYKGKNRKTRIISLPRETINDLREFIRPDLPKRKPIFGLSVRSMSDTVKEIIRKLRVSPNGRGAHGFRHMVIMRMLRDAHVDPAIVAKIAGNTPKTIFGCYSSQVSIDEQRRAERDFDASIKK